MIDRDHNLPVSKQAEVLRISRGSIYYLPRPLSAADLALMRRLDKLHHHVRTRRQGIRRGPSRWQAPRYRRAVATRRELREP